MTLLTDKYAIKDLCEGLQGAPYVALDTEFMRESTYYPQLCLIQIAGPDGVPFALDPLHADFDWAPLKALLLNSKVLKVLHAARQDIEILHHEFGRVPTPLFDTQVAAAYCGYGESIGFAALCSDLAGHQPDKASQFTDWARRPLTERQLEYALDDVRYLVPIYEKLRARLKTKERENWALAEMDALEDESIYKTNPAQAWQRIKLRNAKPKNRVVLQALAAWREEEAMRRDVPKNRIIRDDALQSLATALPKSADKLSDVRGLPPGWAKGENAQRLYKLIHDALNSPKENWPEENFAPRLPSKFGPMLEMLKMLLRIQAMAHDLVPRLITSNEALEAFVQGDTSVDFMKGWRYDVFGKDAENMLEGRLALTVKDGKIRNIELM